MREPVWLIALSSRLRWLVLVSPRLDPFTFFAIPLVRLLAVAAVYYVFGQRYGDRAVALAGVEDGRRASQPILWIERQFHRARYAVIFLLPAGPVRLAARRRRQDAGRSRTTRRRSRACSPGSSLIRLVAGALTRRDPDVTDWVADNQIWLTGVSVVSVFVFALWSQRSGRTEIESVDEIAEELGET